MSIHTTREKPSVADEFAVSPPQLPTTPESEGRWILARPRLVVSLAAFVVLAPLYAYYSYLIGMGSNSDTAINVLQAWDMSHGNPLLSGWVQGNNSWITNELMIYAAVSFFLGITPNVAFISHGIIYAVIVIIAAWLAVGVTRDRKKAVLAVAIVAAILLPVNPDATVGWMFLSIIDHLGTSIPLMILLIVLDRSALTWRAGVATFGILTWAMTSDHLALFVGVLPVVLVAGLRAYFNKERRAGHLALVLGALASIPADAAFKAALEALGGASRNNPPDILFASAADLSVNLWETLDGLMVIFGANVFGRSVTDSKMELMHLAALTVAAIGWILALRSLRRLSIVDQILITAIGINVLAFAFSTMPGAYYTAHEMLVVMPFSAVLAARMIVPRLTELRTRVPVYAGLAIAVGLLATAVIIPPVRNDPTRELRAWLAQSGLTYGIAGFWLAASISVHSEGKTEIVAVINDGRGKVMPFWQVRRVDWYDPQRHDARFIISQEKDWGLSIHDLNGPLVESTFGQPNETVKLRNYVVRIYGYNILTKLPRSP